MKATCTIAPFPLPGTAVHIPPVGSASLLRGDDIKAHLRRLPPGRLLGVFQISSSDDLHSETWEMHPAGDEVLVMLTGELELEYCDGSRRNTSSLQAGHGIVIPKGVWHRLVLHDPGLLLALSAPEGTRSNSDPGRQP